MPEILKHNYTVCEFGVSVIVSNNITGSICIHAIFVDTPFVREIEAGDKGDKEMEECLHESLTGDM
jgi:hypothetical protein